MSALLRTYDALPKPFSSKTTDLRVAGFEKDNPSKDSKDGNV